MSLATEGGLQFKKKKVGVHIEDIFQINSDTSWTMPGKLYGESKTQRWSHKRPET